MVKDGIVTITGKGDAPFLGFGAGKMTGPASVTFRVKSAGGGVGKVEWLPAPAAADKAQSVEYRMNGGDWQDITVALPADGALGIVRLYRPAQKEPVQVDFVELKPATGTGVRADF